MKTLDDPEISALRRTVLDDPRNAELRYLLAAHMAQARDYEGAVLEFSAAVALNPQLHAARFQLGLLHLTLAQPQHTLSVLGPLEALGDDAALKHFKRGLEALIRDDFAGCVQHLQAGIPLNRENEALNKDMTMLIERVRTAMEAQPVATVPPVASPAPAATPQSNVEPVRTDFSLYGLTKH